MDRHDIDRNQRLKEARTIEAIKNGYMGLEGKFCTIAKWLGEPLIRQGGIYVDRTYLDDPLHIPEEGEIPTMGGAANDPNGIFGAILDNFEEEESHEIGIHFDGLSRGINLNITVLFHLREITVWYAGQVVYKELAGELEGFAPFEEWEKKISELFTAARNIERKQRPAEKKKTDELAAKKRVKILEELRLKWGL